MKSIHLYFPSGSIISIPRVNGLVKLYFSFCHAYDLEKGETIGTRCLQPAMPSPWENKAFLYIDMFLYIYKLHLIWELSSFNFDFSKLFKCILFFKFGRSCFLHVYFKFNMKAHERAGIRKLNYKTLPRQIEIISKRGNGSGILEKDILQRINRSGFKDFLSWKKK